MCLPPNSGAQDHTRPGLDLHRPAALRGAQAGASWAAAASRATSAPTPAVWGAIYATTRLRVQRGGVHDRHAFNTDEPLWGGPVLASFGDAQHHEREATNSKHVCDSAPAVMWHVVVLRVSNLEAD